MAAPASSQRSDAPSWSALVLAGRRGAHDELALSRGATHRALIEVAGVPMLVRVLEALRAAPSVAGLRVSIDAPELLESDPRLAAWRREGSLAHHASRESPARSVADALGDTPEARVLVTTADHALLSAARIETFLAGAEATGADVAVGVVERAAFAGSGEAAARTWVRLRGGAYTGANLFAFRTPRGRRAAEFFARAEAHRKRPWRMLAALGVGLGLGYLTGALDLDAAFRRVSRRAGATLRPVRLEEAEAAIDVDKLADLLLAERLLERKSALAEPSAP